LYLEIISSAKSFHKILSNFLLFQDFIKLYISGFSRISFTSLKSGLSNIFLDKTSFTHSLFQDIQPYLILFKIFLNFISFGNHSSKKVFFTSFKSDFQIIDVSSSEFNIKSNTFST
jgi:hypothetical protein